MALSLGNVAAFGGLNGYWVRGRPWDCFDNGHCLLMYLRAKTWATA